MAEDGSVVGVGDQRMPALGVAKRRSRRAPVASRLRQGSPGLATQIRTTRAPWLIVGLPRAPGLVPRDTSARPRGAKTGPLAGLIDPRRVAVAGQSDGGDSALAVAYDPRFRDERVHAAIVLSGAEIPAEGGFVFPTKGPALLATQGTADTINPPIATETFFEAAQRPKYLLSLLGAEHLPPYSSEQPQLTVVEHVTTAFLKGYLEHEATALRELPHLGNAAGIASLRAEP